MQSLLKKKFLVQRKWFLFVVKRQPGKVRPPNPSATKFYAPRTVIWGYLERKMTNSS